MARGGSSSDKLRFSITNVSGEDPDYPSRELLYHHPQTRGWQTPRFCKYPQELTLQLEQPSMIRQIQILSHEYKIATKLEIYVGTPPQGSSDPSRCQMRKLGHLSFDSNDRSSHQARELKSVHVNAPALVFKLVVHRCHINKLNIYNQVGVVALNLIGEPMEGQGGALPMPSQPMMGGHGHGRAPPPVDMGLDMGVDSKTAVKIRELYEQKEAAVEREDYDDAKRLKGAIDRLKAIGAKIGSLEAKKAAAVEREDYDMAKQLKLDIDKLRAGGDSDGFYAGGSRNPRQRQSNDPQEIFDRVLDASAEGGPALNVQASFGGASVEDSMVYASQDRSEAGGFGGGGGGGGYSFDPNSMGDPDGVPPAGNNRLLHSRNGLPPQGPMGGLGGQMYEAYDDRPAQGKGMYRLDSPSVQAMENAPVAPKGPPGPGSLLPPPGFPPDLPAPEPLTSADAVAAEPLVELLGEYVATCLFSKNWQLREAGMQMLEKKLTGGELPNGANNREELRQLTKAVCKALKDKVANVFQGGMNNMRCLFDTYGQLVGNKDLMAASADFVPLLVDKTADNNSRTQAIAAEGLMFLASTPGVEGIIAPHVCKPAKTQTAWKPVLARLDLLQQLVEQFGVYGKGGGSGLPLDGVMKYVAAAYTSPNGDVRSTAVKCTVDVYRHAGNPVRNFFPQEMNKALRDQLEAALDDAGDEAPPAALPQQAAPKEKPKPKDPPPQKRQPAAAAPAPEPAASPHHDELPPLDTSIPEDDPEAYERELAQREAELGPDHPDVAETLSNLAILYNQQGEYGQAQPLYERALAIWEQTQGPDSSDVAHTLTDLAVLHLENGHDELGRPLLERALDIQTRNLGEDHPDVVAIREVLESDD